MIVIVVVAGVTVVVAVSTLVEAVAIVFWYNYGSVHAWDMMYVTLIAVVIASMLHLSLATCYFCYHDCKDGQLVVGLEGGGRGG